ncbi:hypothetical protein C2G38_1013031 [Gigaspora rosea]|uniref:Proteasome component Ecm29 N-terminal domain-containing protein n=1 Tax=Gigaspora rosea TaxID=44941 RepID=A0A397TTB1_9GLOM|nr:hypothetical protein C2G38_1013031 [Gigaspora rosea]
MDYLCKSKLAANTFPTMLHVSFDCLYSPKTNENLQKQGVKFIQWMTRMIDTSRLKLIGKVLLFGLLKIIKEAGTESLDNLTREQEIKTLLFKPFYGPLDLSIHSPEEDNENLKVIIIKFQEFNQLNQLDQWINETNIQEMEKILEENTNKSSHMLHCCILKYAFSIFQFASILKKIKIYFPKIVNLIHEKYTQCTHHLVDTLQISQLTLKDTSFSYYKGSANMENLDGISQSCHCHGIGVEKDEHKAFISYQKSAELGDIIGTFKVGYCYRNGIGVEKDERKAFIYYQKSAEMGHTDGMSEFGNCYEKGIGIEKNEYKAFICYQKSAEMGSASGTFALGNCYKDGIGVEKDERKAFIYYQKSADMKYADGTYQVGDCYRNGIGVEKDKRKAFISFQKSAEMGHADGTCRVGYCYANGIGTEKDKYKAFIYYKKSADMVMLTEHSKLDITTIVKSMVSKGISISIYLLSKICRNGILMGHSKLDIFIDMELELKRMNIRHSFIIKNLQRWDI